QIQFFPVFNAMTKDFGQRPRGTRPALARLTVRLAAVLTERARAVLPLCLMKEGVIETGAQRIHRSPIGRKTVPSDDSLWRSFGNDARSRSRRNRRRLATTRVSEDSPRVVLPVSQPCTTNCAGGTRTGERKVCCVSGRRRSSGRARRAVLAHGSGFGQGSRGG